MKNNAGFQTIALTRIHESTTNPRSIFDESKLAELAASLRTQGLIQPITVRPNSDGYELLTNLVNSWQPWRSWFDEDQTAPSCCSAKPDVHLKK